MTRTGAVAELAVHHDAARVVPVGDADAFATELVGVLTDAALRDTLAARGRSLAAAEFDPSMLVHRIDAVYRCLLRPTTTTTTGSTRS
jgi:glycosyltransferase involved in cell wall biosynthesis